MAVSTSDPRSVWKPDAFTVCKPDFLADGNSDWRTHIFPDERYDQRTDVFSASSSLRAGGRIGWLLDECRNQLARPRVLGLRGHPWARRAQPNPRVA